VETAFAFHLDLPGRLYAILVEEGKALLATKVPGATDTDLRDVQPEKARPLMTDTVDEMFTVVKAEQD